MLHSDLDSLQSPAQREGAEKIVGSCEKSPAREVSSHSSLPKLGARVITGISNGRGCRSPSFYSLSLSGVGFLLLWIEGGFFSRSSVMPICNALLQFFYCILLLIMTISGSAFYFPCNILPIFRCVALRWSKSSVCWLCWFCSVFSRDREVSG